MASMPRLTILLPAWSVFGRQGLRSELASAFGRADLRAGAAPGMEAQLSRHFAMTPAHWAPAALTRQVDAGDASGRLWLRVDPAHVRPDINGARLLGIGERLGLNAQDVEALLPALRPVFGDAGFALDAPTASRWYLSLPRGTTLPAFSAPDDALGEDLFEHQPDGPEGRRWRALLNDVQIVLHNHPWNAQRAERGLVPINALWPWGAGELPHSLRSDIGVCCSDDELPRAMTLLAGGTALPLPPAFDATDLTSSAEKAGYLIDLRRFRDLARLQRDWLQPAVEAVQRGHLHEVCVDSADGSGLSLRASNRWRFWRRSWTVPLRDATP